MLRLVQLEKNYPFSSFEAWYYKGNRLYILIGQVNNASYRSSKDGGFHCVITIDCVYLAKTGVDILLKHALTEVLQIR